MREYLYVSYACNLIRFQKQQIRRKARLVLTPSAKANIWLPPLLPTGQAKPVATHELVFSYCCYLNNKLDQSNDSR